MDATHIPGLDREEPDFWIEDDIPKSDADEREARETAAALDRSREGRDSENKPRE